MKKILWVDLDEVLAETVNEVLKYHDYKVKWQPIFRNDISDYYISNIPKYNLVKEDAITFFGSVLTSPARENILPVQWAKEKLQILKQQWRTIVVVTARREEISEYTKHRLDRFYPWLIDDVLFANHFSANEIPKSTLCKHHWIEIMIEDNLDFAIELAKYWITVFLLDKPWNSNYTPSIHLGIKKVATRADISL